MVIKIRHNCDILNRNETLPVEMCRVLVCPGIAVVWYCCNWIAKYVQSPTGQRTGDRGMVRDPESID